ncbi:MAG: tetratricopeptide repeat protein [Promethearchaeota archaeon]
MSWENSAWLLCEEALKKFDNHEFDDSLHLFRSASRINESDHRIFFNHALAAAKLGLYSEAIEMLERGFKLKDNDPNAIKLLKQVILSWDMPGDGASIIKKLKWIENYFDMKIFWLNSTLRPKMSSLIDGFLSINDKLSYSNDFSTEKKIEGTNAGTGLKKNDDDVGVALYSEAIDRSSSYRHLMLPDLENLTLKQILDFLSKDYKGLTPDEKTKVMIWLFSKGKKLYDDSDYERAADIFRFMAKLEPEHIAVLLNCGIALRDSGDMKLIRESVTYFKQILEINYYNNVAWFDLAISYLMLGDFQRELFCLKKAWELGNSRVDLGRIAYLEKITHPVSPFE